MNRTTKSILCAGLMAVSLSANADTWTLQQCMDYANEHSIDLKKNRVSELDAEATLAMNKAALFPSLTASVGQSVSYRPWSSASNRVITDGSGSMTTVSTSSATQYTGSYGLNLNYTLWNGGRRTKTIEQQKMNVEKAELTTEQQLNTIKQQIVQLYVQILYSREAIIVNKKTLETSIKQRDRAAEMVKVGSLSKADLAQLEAQVAEGEYNVTTAEVAVDRYKLNLKQLLELPAGDDFDVAETSITDEMALQMVPNADEIYQAAVANRPEIRGAKVSVDIADKQIQIAKTQNLPSVSLSAAAGTSNMSGTQVNLGTQWKNSTNTSAGLNVQIPIFSQRQNRTAVERAELQKQTAQLEVENQQKKLRSSIDGYWLDATSSQAQFRSAAVNVDYMQASYDLLSEQFNVGLKNIVELMSGKDKLLKAQQTALQAKYTSVYNQQLLKYYGGEEFKL